MNIRQRVASLRSRQNKLGHYFDYQTLEPRQLLAGLVNSSLATGIGGPTSLYFELNEPAPVEQRMEILRSHLRLDHNEQLRLIDLDRDDLGFAHLKYQQFHNGIPVEGGVYKAHVFGGQLVGLSGDYKYVGDISTQAELTESEALTVALDYVGAEIYAWESSASSGTGNFISPGDPHGHIEDLEIPTGQPVILKNAEGENRLTYKFDIYAVQPLSRGYVFVDAINGDIVQVYDQINEFDVPASGTSLYNGTVEFTADDTGALYRLRQAAQGIQTFTMNGFTNYGAATDITSISNTFTASSVHTGVQAHWGAEQTMFYYAQMFGRDSFDDSGGLLQVFTSYGNGLNTAFWDGSVLTFGDGDGFNLTPLVSLDVVGHEFSHAVNDYSANLVYFIESGALDESFSDIFGEAVEHFATGSNDWLVGEEIVIGSGAALRSLSDPKSLGDPDTYFGENWYTGGDDFGGVHTNSGVQNHWFYLLSEGGFGTNDGNVSYDIEGIGIQNAAAIAYRNLTVYLTPDSQYVDARVGAIQSAIDLFGVNSPERISTEAAWDAVGVYDPNVELLPIAADVGTSGSMIYSVQKSDSFDLGFTDTYIVPLDDAQNLTAAVVGEGSLIPRIQIYDPAGAPVGATTGTGNLAALQSVPVVKGGFYFVVIDGANNTYGEYSLEILLNADAELEFHGGADNGDMNSAQSLETSSLGYYTPSQSAFVDRLAVVGSLAGEPPTGTAVFSDSFEAGTLGTGWTTSSTGNGRIRLTTLHGAADGSYALVMDTTSGYALNEAILAFDLSTIANPQLKVSNAEWGDETHPLPASFSGSFNGDGIAISDDGINWYTILTNMSSNPGEWVDVSIDLVDAAAMAGIALDQNFRVKFQQYDNFSLPDDGRAFDAIEIVDTEPAADWYTFDVANGQYATAFVTSVAGSSSVQLDIFNEIGALIYSGTSTAELDSVVDPLVGSGETYFARVTGDANYNLIVTRGAGFNLEPNDLTPQNITNVDAVFGSVISLGIVGAEPDDAPFETNLDRWFYGVTLSNNITGGSVYSFDATGFGAPTGNAVFARDPVAMGFFWRLGADELRADFDILQQTVSIDVGADGPGGDLAWMRAFNELGILIGEVHSDLVPQGGRGTMTISRPTADIAYIVAAGEDGHVAPLDNLVFDVNLFDEDLYSLDVSAGDELTLTASIPGAGPNLFQNRLFDTNGSHLFIELIDPSGNSVAVDNWTIQHTAGVSGTYIVKVFADESAGEYILFKEVVVTGIEEPSGIDFGTDTSPVYLDYAGVSDNPYDSDVGYGWLSTSGLIPIDGINGDDLTRDSVSLRNGTFAIDVDDGMYDVDVVLGIATKTDRGSQSGGIGDAPTVRITVENQIDTFTPLAGSNVVRSFVANVTDGQLTFEFDGLTGLNNRINISGITLNQIQGLSGKSNDSGHSNLRINPSLATLRVSDADPSGRNEQKTSILQQRPVIDAPPVAIGLSGSVELKDRVRQQAQEFWSKLAQDELKELADFTILAEISEELLSKI